MNRVFARVQLARDSWLYLLLIVVPVLASSQLPGLTERMGESLAFPLFFIALGSLFFSLPAFTASKHTLIGTEKALGSEAETAVWKTMRATRLRGQRIAGLPAWIAAAGAPLGIDPVAQFLLVCGSLTLLVLYRVPRQLR